jgi:hypothetical protein
MFLQDLLLMRMPARSTAPASQPVANGKRLVVEHQERRNIRKAAAEAAKEVGQRTSSTASRSEKEGTVSQRDSERANETRGNNLKRRREGTVNKAKVQRDEGKGQVTGGKEVADEGSD